MRWPILLGRYFDEKKRNSVSHSRNKKFLFCNLLFQSDIDFLPPPPPPLPTSITLCFLNHSFPRCAVLSSTHVVNGMMVSRRLSAEAGPRGGGEGGAQVPVDLNNQIIGISKNNGFLTSPRPLTLSFKGRGGLNLNPSYSRTFGWLPPQVNPTASGPSYRGPVSPTQRMCWDKPSHWTAVAFGFLPLLLFAVVF